MRQYSTHKRFISDVVRYTNPEMVAEASSYFILLRSCSVMKDITHDQIAWVVSKIVDMDISNIYRQLYKDGSGLTTQEITFRIKRIKYIAKNSNDDLEFKFPNVLSEIGTTFKNTIVIPYIEVKRMTEEKVEKKPEEEKQERKQKTQETLNWVLENVKWKGRDGTVNNGTMSASQASKEIGLSPMRIRGILRDYYAKNPVKSDESKSESKPADELGL